MFLYLTTTNIMKNIHVIPTLQPSKLYKVKDKLYLEEYPDKTVNAGNQHIYITSDEKIISSKDWFIDIKDNRNHLHQVGYGLDSYEWTEQYDPQYYKKIILTTDQDLIADGVQAIHDEFLEWFVKNPSCEEVEVEKGCKIDCTRFILNGENSMCCGDYKYKILPQEEPKQEHSTLNLDILKSKVDNALENETKKSLTEWLETQRNKQETCEFLKDVGCIKDICTCNTGPKQNPIT